jgi:hypothetical protein
MSRLNDAIEMLTFKAEHTSVSHQCGLDRKTGRAALYCSAAP